jgi:glucose-1-phosphate cytidylyltransferase
MRINGGYFILRQDIFNYLNENEDLVMDGCVRAGRAGKFRAVRFDGFWAPMDTLKERAALEDMHRTGNRPWALWERSQSTEFVPHAPVRSFTMPADSSHVA